MNPIFKKIPGFVSLIRPFPCFKFQKIEADPTIRFYPKLQLTVFSKNKSGSFKKKKISFGDIKDDYFPLHFVKGISFKLL